MIDGFEYLIIGLILLGINYLMICKGKYSLLHTYHYKRVSEDKRIEYGKKMGQAQLFISISLIASGILTCVQYVIFVPYVLAIGFILGIVLSIYYAYKYNSGLF